MKVVLLKEVSGVGRAGDIKNVADGYALNFLIPRKLAEAGTDAAIARAEKRMKEQKVECQIQENLLAKNIAGLEGLKIEISEKANEKGHLFSGVHKETIVSELKKQKNIDLLPEFIQLEHPIKAVGEYSIAIKAAGQTASFTLIISPEPPSVL